MRVVLFNLRAGAQRLLIVVHHLAVDAVSWRILLEDLWRAYAQLARGEAGVCRHDLVIRRLGRAPRSERSLGVVPRGDRCLAARTSRSANGAVARARQADPGDNTIGSRSRASVSLDQEETRTLLQDVPGVSHADQRRAAQRSGAHDSGVDGRPAGAGRSRGPRPRRLFDDIDLSRTVGMVHEPVSGPAGSAGRRRLAQRPEPSRTRCARCPHGHRLRGSALSVRRSVGS